MVCTGGGDGQRAIAQGMQPQDSTGTLPSFKPSFLPFLLPILPVWLAISILKRNTTCQPSNAVECDHTRAPLHPLFYSTPSHLCIDVFLWLTNSACYCYSSSSSSCSVGVYRSIISESDWDRTHTKRQRRVPPSEDQSDTVHGER